MTLLAFYVTSFLTDKYGHDSQSNFKGLISRNPIAAITMLFTLFSLAGLPPFSGFIAKFNMLSVVITKKYYTLAFIAAINSVISLYYYMKLVRVIVFEKHEDTEPFENIKFLQKLGMVALAVPVLVLGIFWEKAYHLVELSNIYMK